MSSIACTGITYVGCSRIGLNGLDRELYDSYVLISSHTYLGIIMVMIITIIDQITICCGLGHNRYKPKPSNELVSRQSFNDYNECNDKHTICGSICND